MPLSPHIAYVSCEHYIDLYKGQVAELNDLMCIFWLYINTVRNAHGNIYSPIIESIKGEGKLSDYLINEKNTDLGLTAKIFTEKNRYSFPITNYNPENEQIEFCTDHSEFAESVSEGDEVSFIEIYNDGSSCQMMRNCFLKRIDHTSNKYVVEPHIKLGF